MIEAEVKEVIVMGTVADCVETLYCTELSVRCQERDGDTLAAGTLPVVTPTPTTQQQLRGQHQTGGSIVIRRGLTFY